MGDVGVVGARGCQGADRPQLGPCAAQFRAPVARSPPGTSFRDLRIAARIHIPARGIRARSAAPVSRARTPSSTTAGRPQTGSRRMQDALLARCATIADLTTHRVPRSIAAWASCRVGQPCACRRRWSAATTIIRAVIAADLLGSLRRSAVGSSGLTSSVGYPRIPWSARQGRKKTCRRGPLAAEQRPLACAMIPGAGRRSRVRPRAGPG